MLRLLIYACLRQHRLYHVVDEGLRTEALIAHQTVVVNDGAISCSDASFGLHYRLGYIGSQLGPVKAHVACALMSQLYVALAILLVRPLEDEYGPLRLLEKLVVFAHKRVSDVDLARLINFYETK